MPEIQEKIKIRFRRLDDVFHRMIIALERLELFLEKMRLEDNVNPELTFTAIHTDRDTHNDETNPPSRDSFFGEVQLDCSALFFQTKFDDRQLFEKAVKYFLNDLLEWYGGRKDSIPFDGVDAFILPIIMSLSRQVDSVSEILEVTEKYVAHIPNIQDYSDEEKADAIAKAMETLILIMDSQKNKHESYEVDTVFSVHKRGSAIEGYKRLINAMLSLFDEAMPSILVYRTVQNYLPEITDTVPTITEEVLISYVENKSESSHDINLDDKLTDPTNQFQNNSELHSEHTTDEDLNNKDKNLSEEKEINHTPNDLQPNEVPEETGISNNIFDNFIDKVKTILN